MDRLQNQIIDLNQKVDGLYQIVEHLSNQISTFVTDKQEQSAQLKENFSDTVEFRRVERRNQDSNELLMSHKDILNDDSSWDSHTEYDSEKNLPPEIQIRRLTVQLTAAYNRIAALEEQLLARRIHV
ncbi:hypothetical protein [Oscillatoria salina]|uniref:hypothetical protein n=1 Tax=Oscillatoria salina TaxID=331517 RepID=UPI0013BE24E6|nr:hypothetical protein [Oscillatoria salina]MBZ8181321.1 hypothetical protein [Oscillatoria salina IIICB1]NET87805.1 hypothetical protein [Kamptonema sp. SIO1D9]